jgi:RNA polymerase sigma factor (sigma-70 family)
MVDASHGLAGLIQRVKGGDASARQELFARAHEQLECMARKRLDQQFGRLRFRGVETGDVLNDAMLQLLKRLEQPGGELDRLSSERDFFVMAAQYIRWALLNTAKRFAQRDRALPGDDLLEGETVHPFSLNQMTEFHAEVERLAPELRQVFELIYFCDRTYEQAAELLDVHRDTVKRRYREAKDALKKVFQE